MNEDEELDEQEFFDYLITNGYIEMVGIDRHADPVYKMTKKMIEEFPDIFQEHLSLTNDLVFSVWQKGLLEVHMTDSGSWEIVPNKRTFEIDEYEDELTDEEYILMVEVIEMSKRNYGKM